MATQVILPKLGQTMEQGTIVEWFKHEGDPVQRGDVLFNVESDKAVLEVEARTKGILRKILVGPGTKVPVGTPVAIIAEPDEDVSALLGAAAQGQPAVEAAVQPESGKTGPSPSTPQPVPEEKPMPEAGGRLFASPRARMTARERGVALTEIAGSGPGGRIIERDVLEYLNRQPAATPLAGREARRLGVSLAEVQTEERRVRVEDVRAAAAKGAAPAAAAGPEGELQPLSGVRAVIAERMATSAQTTAAVTLHTVVEATELVRLREALKEAFAEKLGFNIGYNDILGVIVARCLVEFPYMNARLEEGGIRHLSTVNLGLAVDSERGLLVPVIHGADKLGIVELARAFREAVARVREGRATPDDLTGGTFTITNLGMFGVDMFTPIINLPECAILGVGRIHPESVAIGDRVEVRQRMWLSLTFDHRLVDGAPAARFLQAIGRYVESPWLLLA